MRPVTEPKKSCSDRFQVYFRRNSSADWKLVAENLTYREAVDAADKGGEWWIHLMPATVPSLPLGD